MITPVWRLAEEKKSQKYLYEQRKMCSVGGLTGVCVCARVCVCVYLCTGYVVCMYVYLCMCVCVPMNK